MAKTVYKQNTYKNSRKGESSSWVNQVLDFVLQDQRFQFILGFFLMIGSFAMLLSFVSYFFTGKADQSVVEVVLSASIQETGREVENWLGLSGAVLAHVLIFKWFGIASFALVPVVFLLGWRLSFKTEIYPILEMLKFSAFSIFWISLVLGALFSRGSEMGFWAGGIGYNIATALGYLFGIFTIPIILSALLVFIIYTFKMPNNISGGNIFNSLAKEFKNVQDRFTENGSEEEDDEEEETKKTKTSTSSKGKTVIKNNFSKDIILEINDDDSDTKPKRTSPKTTPPKGKDDKNTHLELEIDPASFAYDNPADRNGEEDDFFEEDNTFSNKSGKGIQKPIDFEGKEIDQEDVPPKKITPLNELDEENNTFKPSIGSFPDEVEESEYVKGESSNLNSSGLFDPTLELSKYVPPSLDLLDDAPIGRRQVSDEELKANKDKIVETLSNYGIGISQIKATIGPTVTLYEIIPEAGVRISKIKNLEDDIALSLAALGIRIIAPIPGKGTIGIEVPNKKRELVSMRSVLESDAFLDDGKDLPIVLGKSITNEVVVYDLAKMPHLLIAGATGQGKSVGLNVILTSLIYKKHPAELKFVLIDPKKVELTLFNKIEKHFLAKLPNEDEAIITDTDKVVNTLKSLTKEMDNRYTILKEAACRNIKEYNRKFVNRRLSPKKGHKYLPYIVLVIDELADLMMVAGKEVEQPIARLAQLARAIGIHLIVATQRPSVNVITGIIKANFPARLSFKVTSKIDSRTILDAGGADQLVGMGDLLFSMGAEAIRLQCPFIDTPEVERICDYINMQQSFKTAYELPESDVPDLDGFGGDDDYEKDVLFEEAARIIVMHQQGSTSLLQRRLKLGYNRAGRLIDQLEKAGIVGPFEGSKAREVLIPDEYSLERLLTSIDK
jgi:S-DNA-T family DNA segregation ATPase FtsK/SpoIIIE